MAYWNHRIIRKANSDPESVRYQIHEVYYREDGSIEGWTESPVEPFGESVAELREEIHFFLKAFQKPVLEEQQVDGKPALIPLDEDQPVNSGHYFEYMDRAYVASDYVCQYLGSHPLTKKEETLLRAYERVEEALAGLYQEAGRLENERTRR